LDFYSDRTIVPASLTQLQHSWLSDGQPYFLLDEPALTALKNLKLESVKLVGHASGWSLITKNTK
jgi:hypothetical protein